MTSTTYNSLENIVDHLISCFNELSPSGPNWTPRISIINHTSTDNGIMDESKTETYVITYRILGLISENPKLLEQANLKVFKYLENLIDNLLVKGIHQMHQEYHDLYPLKEITLKGGSYNKILHDTDGAYLYMIKYSDNYIYITLTSSGY